MADNDPRGITPEEYQTDKERRLFAQQIDEAIGRRVRLRMLLSTLEWATPFRAGWLQKMGFIAIELVAGVIETSTDCQDLAPTSPATYCARLDLTFGHIDFEFDEHDYVLDGDVQAGYVLGYEEATAAPRSNVASAYEHHSELALV